MTTQNPANVSFVVTNDWGDGFTADLTIRNTGTTPINGWTLAFNAPYAIDQAWSSTLTKLPDGRYSVSPLSWNTTIPAGGSISFGYRGTKAAGTVAQAPTNYTLNGMALSTGTTTSTPTVLPDLSISDATIAEGGLNTNGQASALFTVKLSQASTSPVTVGYATQNGTAIAGQDFTATQGTLTFAAGETSKTIAVPILNDTAVESTESFSVVLSNATQAKIIDTTGVGTITDNDAVAPVLPDLVISDATLTEGALNANGASSALFKVSLSKASTSQVTVDYLTQGGTAIAGQDFTAAQGKLTFAPGETTKTIAVPITNDTLVEPSESFNVVLSNASQAKILDATGVGTIVDNDQPAATASPFSVEFKVTGDWGTTFTSDLVIRNTGTTPINGWTLTFKAPYTIDQNWNSTLTKLPDGRYSVTPASWNTTIPAGGTVSFGYRGLKAAGTTATAPTDYQLNGISLSNPGTVSTPTLPDLTVSDATLTEGALNTNGASSALFTVKLSQASTSPVTVGYTTQNGTATAGQDFTAMQGTLTFAAGETSKTIAVPILNDTSVESTETFNLVLSNATQAKILDGLGVGTILDNDAVTSTPTLPSLSIGNATLAEGALNASGAASTLFTVTLSKASTSPVT
ncbi:MAG TPA: Calx-beta domain-containing protein, partial [Trichocoleus sp.]